MSSQQNQTSEPKAPDIKTSFEPYRPLPSRWSAIDANTYDADCDQDGYFSDSAQGWGPTREAAIADLLEQLEAA